MILYDRARISRKNSWIDKYGNIYLIFPTDEIGLQPVANKAVEKMAITESEKPHHLVVKMAVQESEMWHLVK